MGDLSEWVGLFHADSRISEKEKQNDIDRKRFSTTYPVVNKFPSVSNFHRYPKQKTNQRVTVAEPGSPSESRIKTHQTSKQIVHASSELS